MPIVDTHQHLWDLGRFSYSWCAGIPALNRTFDLEDYLAAAAGLEIVKTIFVECDVDEPHALGEARAIQQLADRQPLIAGIVAGCRPEHEGFAADLELLAGLTKVRGLRRVLHTQPDELSRRPLFAANVRRLADYGYTFDLCVLARQLPLAAALVEACPRVAFVLDHCGVPDVKARALDPWREEIRRIAGLPNVVCKVSGLVAYAEPERWTDADLRPWIEHVVACFGWDRLLWGSDWPVCTPSPSLRRCTEPAARLVAGATPDQRDRLFRRNAERVYRV